jgi:hypothetical protein
MTLANVRAQGVRSLWVVCDLCHTFERTDDDHREAARYGAIYGRACGRLGYR